MAVKITTKLDLKKFLPNINSKWTKKIRKTIADQIVATITSGTSPVTGKRFVGYSPQYAKTKGRVQPVDILVSGETLESLKVTQRKDNSLSIFSRNKIFKIHNDGEGNNPERRLLPDRSGETFTDAILKRILIATNKIVSREVKRQNA